MEPDATEIRVLGCLIEKQRATPDAYPLSLNALRLACNQATNRDPVVDYDEETVSEALRRLRERRWARVATLPGRRTVKYRHLLGEALDLDDSELATLAVLMLRGPQTPGELKQRTERLHSFADLGAVSATLERLADRGLAVRLERRAGEKQARYAQLLGGDASEPAAASGPAVTAEPDPAGGTAGEPTPAADLAARVERLEDQVESLRAEVAALRQQQ